MEAKESRSLAIAGAEYLSGCSGLGIVGRIGNGALRRRGHHAHKE